MTIGLVVLALVAILIFFGISERFFRSLGITNWLAFILVLALVVGAIAPSISINTFSLNVGGFLVPLIIMTVLMVVMKFGAELLRAAIAIMAVAAVAVATRMLIEPSNGGLILASSLIIGFAGGMVAFLVGQTRLATLAGAMGGIILGDIVVNFLYTYALGGYSFTLGSYGVFDSVVIASVFGIIICEVVAAIKSTAEKRSKTPKRAKTGLASAATIEAAEDNDITLLDADLLDENVLDEENIVSKSGSDIESAEDYQLLSAIDESNDDTSTDAFFDDYV